MIKPLIEKINKIGVLPEDDALQKNQKNFVVYEAVLMSMGGLLWGGICFSIGKHFQSSIPLGYVVLSFLNILLFSKNKNFRLAQAFQTGISLLLPFIFQWTMGGFLASGASMLWAILSLAASLSYSSIRASMFWLFFFVLLTVFSGIYDSTFSTYFPPDYGMDVFIALLTLNIAIISTIIFFLIIFYVSENEKSYLKAKDAQLILIQSEKLAALGQLSAGVAHEINTPLGAIKALAQEAGDLLDNFTKNAAPLFVRLPENQKQLIIQILETHEIKKEFLTTRDERQIRSRLTAELSEKKIEDPEQIARQLVLIDFFSFEESLQRLKGPHFKESVQLLFQFFILQKNNLTILRSVDKASRVVNALKMYLHSSEGVAAVSYSLREVFDTVLTIYENQLKRGVHVLINIPDDLMLTGYVEEISQVWTNLIVNACQAMNFNGDLSISAKDSGNKVMVEISDSGCGIPESVGDKIFDAFYSTKKIGEGSGLGLNIVKKIVLRHQGRVYYKSAPGNGTTFYVELPKRVASAE
jgi:signal transduction histidine kinase